MGLRSFFSDMRGRVEQRRDTIKRPPPVPGHLRDRGVPSPPRPQPAPSPSHPRAPSDRSGGLGLTPPAAADPNRLRHHAELAARRKQERAARPLARAPRDRSRNDGRSR